MLLPAQVHELWPRLAALHGDAPMLVDPHAPEPCSYSFREMAAAVRQAAAGLASLGLCKGEVVSLFSENSSRWLVADQAVMACGAADAVRGVGSSVEASAGRGLLPCYCGSRLAGAAQSRRTRLGALTPPQGLPPVPAATPPHPSAPAATPAMCRS